MKTLLLRRRFEVLALCVASILCLLHAWSSAQPSIGAIDQDSRTGFASTTIGRALLRTIHTLDGKVADQKFRFRGPRAPHPDLVVLEVDEVGAQRFGLWPWPRSLMARAIRNLDAAGVRAVGLDITFADASNDPRLAAYADAVGELDREMRGASRDAAARLASVRTRLTGRQSPDAELAAAFKAAPQVVQGLMAYPPLDRAAMAHRLDRDREYLKDHVLTGFPGDHPGSFFEVDPERVPSFPSYSAPGPVPVIAAAGSRMGHLNVAPDLDGTLRRTPIVTRLAEPLGFLTSLEIQTAALYLGAEPELAYDPVAQKLRGVRLRLPDGSGRLVPLADDEPFTRINHLGDRKVFDRISLADVVDGTVPEERLRGKVALVGITLVGNFDQRVTPFDEFEPGVFTHASFLSNILTEEYLSRPMTLLLAELLFILLAAFAIARLLPRAGFAWKLGVVALIAAGYMAVDQLLFNQGLLMATVLPLASVFFSAFGIIFLGYLSTDAEKAQLRSAFQHYLNENVMQQMLAHPDKLKLGGEKKEMTVLFSDIRGFTTLSERMAPEALVKFINSYLTPMTQIVFEEGGTLDKYIGDALMAFWGAPLDQPDHAIRACRAAVRFQEKMVELKAIWRDQNLPEFDIGVGINTGPMIVGNMGSDIRFDYTVMGDAVNLGARLEGTNKEYETRLLVSEATFLAAQGHVIGRRLGAVRVKGKRRPVRIYELRGLGVAQGDEALAIATFEAGLEAYVAQRFEEAERLFSEVLTLWPEDHATRRYLAEIGELKVRPPGPQWDGVYVATTK